MDQATAVIDLSEIEPPALRDLDGQLLLVVPRVEEGRLHVELHLPAVRVGSWVAADLEALLARTPLALFTPPIDVLVATADSLAGRERPKAKRGLTLVAEREVSLDEEAIAELLSFLRLLQIAVNKRRPPASPTRLSPLAV